MTIAAVWLPCGLRYVRVHWLDTGEVNRLPLSSAEGLLGDREFVEGSPRLAAGLADAVASLRNAGVPS